MRYALKTIVTGIILASMVLGFAQLLQGTRVAVAQETTFFRIGTGGVLGTYYRVGGVIAETISNPPGSYPCERGGDCGVPGLIAIAQTSGGSIANLGAITDGLLESGFAQSDTSYSAFRGEGAFADRPPADQLRVITPLFGEQLQLVVYPESDIETVADIRGKRVSIDTEDSGTIVVTRRVLDSFGITEDEFEAIHVKPAEAIDLMAAGNLDAFFIMAGAPTPSVIEAISRNGAYLVPIAGGETEALLAENPAYQATTIDDYGDSEPINTIGVTALWLVDASASEELIYEITKALYRPEAEVIMSSLPDDLQILMRKAPLDLAIPLHPGSKRYFEENWNGSRTD
ncbi:MAG: TAXI family TRAP transporter solute-binding subunit [Pseudomonadota bacterium]